MLWIAHVASFLPALQSLRLEDTLKQFAAPLKEQVCGSVEVWGVEGRVWEGACCTASAGTEGKLQLEVGHRAVRGEPFGLSNPQHLAALAVTCHLCQPLPTACAWPCPRTLFPVRLTLPVRPPTCSASTTTSGALTTCGSLYRCTRWFRQTCWCGLGRDGGPMGHSKRRQVAAAVGEGGRLQQWQEREAGCRGT